MPDATQRKIDHLEGRILALRAALKAVHDGYLGDLTAEENFVGVQNLARRALEEDDHVDRA